MSLKLKSFALWKTLLKEYRTNYRLREILANYISKKQIVSRIHKNLSKLNYYPSECINGMKSIHI